MPADELATRLTGGVTAAELPDDDRARRSAARAAADRLRPAAAPEPALHARHERLDLRRRLDQPDVLAGAPARDAERRGGLPLPPALPRRRLPDLVRRRRPRLGHGAIEGGDIMPVGDGVVLVGLGERSTARAVSILAQEPVRRRRRAARDRGADAARARGDAPRHGLHVLRPRRRHDLRAGRRRRSCPILFTPGRRRRRPGRALRALVPRRGQGRARDRGAEGRHDRRRRVRGRAQPVGRRQQRRRARARRRRRLRAQRGDEPEAREGRRSRCSRSPARSSAAAAAAATA